MSAPVSSTNKTDNIAEILLKVALNTSNLNHPSSICIMNLEIQNGTEQIVIVDVIT